MFISCFWTCGSAGTSGRSSRRRFMRALTVYSTARPNTETSHRSSERGTTTLASFTKTQKQDIQKIDIVAPLKRPQSLRSPNTVLLSIQGSQAMCPSFKVHESQFPRAFIVAFSLNYPCANPAFFEILASGVGTSHSPALSRQVRVGPHSSVHPNLKSWKNPCCRDHFYSSIPTGPATHAGRRRLVDMLPFLPPLGSGCAGPSQTHAQPITLPSPILFSYSVSPSSTLIDIHKD